MLNKESLNIEIDGSCLFGHQSGIANYTYNLIKYLAQIEKKDRFTVHYSHYPLLKKSTIDFKQHNLINRKIRLPLPNASGFDIYHDTCNIFPMPKIKVKKIITVHDIADFLLPDLISESSKKHMATDLSAALNESDAVIVPSYSTMNDLTRHFNISPSKITVIYEGVDTNFKPEPTYQVSLAKTRYGIKQPYILFAGPVCERKNIKRVLEAYALLKYESPPDLIMTGDKKIMEESVSEISKKLEIENSSKYIGYVPTKMLSALYSGAEFLIWPSLYEGFGLPILEAMSCGTPVISSNISSIPEITGDAAILVDPYDTGAIADSMKNLLSNRSLRAELSEKGRSRSRMFSLKKMAQETLDLYRRVAAK